jgi:hypothetical protein
MNRVSLIFMFIFYSTAPLLAQSVDTAWVRRHDGVSGWDMARAIALDDSGNVYVTGESFGGGTYADFATIKYYSDGDTL